MSVHMHMCAGVWGVERDRDQRNNIECRELGLKFTCMHIYTYVYTLLQFNCGIKPRLTIITSI
jgi:hypothetical protein